MLTVNIEAFVDHLFFHDEYFSNEIVAAYDPKDFSSPTRPVIAKDKERIKSWMVDDFGRLYPILRRYVRLTTI